MKDPRAYQQRTDYPKLAPLIEKNDQRLEALELGATGDPIITVGPLGATLRVGIQFRNPDGTNLSLPAYATAWVASTSYGAVSAVGTSGTISDPGVGLVLETVVAAGEWRFVSNVTGYSLFCLVDGAAAKRVFHVVWNGRVYVAPTLLEF